MTTAEGRHRVRDLDELIARLLEGLTPAERARGLALEERLTRLPPDQRAAVRELLDQPR